MPTGGFYRLNTVKPQHQKFSACIWRQVGEVEWQACGDWL